MIRSLFRLFFPKLCYGCHSLLLKSEEIICSNCLHALPETYHLQFPENNTAQKFFGIVPLESAVSMLHFHKHGIVQNLIHSLKYKGKQEIGAFFGCLFADELSEFIVNQKIDEIIPVPIHTKRLKKRGYNQIHSFCQTLAEKTQIPMNKTLLLRTIHTATQTKKNKEARQYNDQNPFETNHTEVHHGKHYLIVDDVITTGATLEKCAKALLKIPNTRVSILTIAVSDT